MFNYNYSLYNSIHSDKLPLTQSETKCHTDINTVIIKNYCFKINYSRIGELRECHTVILLQTQPFKSGYFPGNLLITLSELNCAAWAR